MQSSRPCRMERFRSRLTTSQRPSQYSCETRTHANEQEEEAYMRQGAESSEAFEAHRIALRGLGDHDDRAKAWIGDDRIAERASDVEVLVEVS